MTAFAKSVIEPGAEIRTDAHLGYNGLAGAGFVHAVTNLSNQDDPAHVLMPRVHRAASLLKRWWLGTHQGGVSKSQLCYYLDEFTFRFNRRSSKYPGLLFYRLVEQAVVTDHVPFKKLLKSRRPRATLTSVDPALLAQAPPDAIPF